MIDDFGRAGLNLYCITESLDLEANRGAHCMHGDPGSPVISLSFFHQMEKKHTPHPYSS